MVSELKGTEVLGIAGSRRAAQGGWREHDVVTEYYNSASEVYRCYPPGLEKRLSHSDLRGERRPNGLRSRNSLPSSTTSLINQYQLLCKDNLSPLLKTLCTLGVLLAAGGNLSRRLIDIWELRPPRGIRSTVVFEGVDICAEEQRSGCSGPWCSLSYYMAVRRGASESVSAAV